jgi:hypothetical protein
MALGILLAAGIYSAACPIPFQGGVGSAFWGHPTLPCIAFQSESDIRPLLTTGDPWYILRPPKRRWTFSSNGMEPTWADAHGEKSRKKASANPDNKPPFIFARIGLRGYLVIGGIGGHAEEFYVIESPRRNRLGELGSRN